MPIPPQPDNIPTNFDPVRVTGVPKKFVAPKTYIGIDPEGNEHPISAENKNDWARRPGHRIAGPVVAKAAPAPEPVEVTAEDPKGQGDLTTAQDDAAKEALSPLQTLRDEATALGIEWKPQWGLKRLTAAIEDAKAAGEPEEDVDGE